MRKDLDVVWSILSYPEQVHKIANQPKHRNKNLIKGVEHKVDLDGVRRTLCAVKELLWEWYTNGDLHSRAVQGENELGDRTERKKGRGSKPKTD